MVATQLLITIKAAKKQPFGCFFESDHNLLQ